MTKESTRATTAPDQCQECLGKGVKPGIGHWYPCPSCSQPSPSTGEEPATDSTGRMAENFATVADALAGCSGKAQAAFAFICARYENPAAREPAPVARELDVEAERRKMSWTDSPFKTDYYQAQAWAQGWNECLAARQATAESAPASAAPPNS